MLQAQSQYNGELRVNTSALPYSQVFVNTGDPIEEKNLMEFRLLYQGELFASANGNNKSIHKHAVRRKLHPQLRKQWSVHSGLRQIATQSGNPSTTNPESTELEKFDVGLAALSNQWRMFGFEFIPMVTKDQMVRCSIDILLLRPEEDKYVFQRGDIDGQVKTLFDALQMPRSEKEAGGGMGPQDDETPFFCLLEDDRLISEVRVNSEQLLLLPTERTVKASDAFAVIHVKVNAKQSGGLGNYW
jgi:hypothetical protein